MCTICGNAQINFANMYVNTYKYILIVVKAYSCESWTTNERQRSKMNSTKTRFIKKPKNKTGLDRIRNEVYRDELKVESTEVT